MKFDVMIIGTGPGGYVCAEKAAKLGLKVAIAENRELGGTCLNRGCIPAKAMLHSAELYQSIKNSQEFGIISQEPEVDMDQVHVYKEAVLEKLRGGIAQLFQANKITCFQGKAVLEKDGAVTVYGDEKVEKVECENVVLATGSVPTKIPIPGIQYEGILTSDELFQLKDHLPESLVIIGGGVISVEFAQVFSSFGTKVTIIEAMPQILPMMDKEISRSMSMLLKKRGVEIYTGAKVMEISEDETGLYVSFEEKGIRKTTSGEKVLVAVGRSANTEDVLGEGVSLEMEKGKILTDENFMTSMDHVYAIGDVTKSVQLAHVASAQGKKVAAILAGKESEIDLTVIPSCVYTSPEIATVGITEQEAKALKKEVKTGKAITSANGKSVISHEERGFVKLVFEKESHVLLGAQFMCARATDMIGEMATAIANKMTAEQLLKAMRAHPTVNEMIGEAIEDAVSKLERG